MKKGFTLVELVIVIVIVGILSIVAVPIYRGYVEKAQVSEAKALLASIKTAQTIYYAEHGAYYASGWAEGYEGVLGIDARGNKYYKTFATGNWGAVPGCWFAAVLNANLPYININLAWNADPSQPPVVHNGYRTPFFYYLRNGEETYSNS